MATSKLLFVALFGALLCAATAREITRAGATTDDSKIDISVGLAPPPGTLAVGINDTINIATPGLAPPPGNLVSINTNNTIIVGNLPKVPLPGRSFTSAATDESKLDIGIGLAPPPSTLTIGVNDSINIGTPGLAPPPGNLVSINTNNTISVPLRRVPQPPVRL